MILKARKISKVYGTSGRSGSPKYALKNVSVELQANEFVAVVGESGSGKSTLARIMLGLIEPSDGCVEVNGVDLCDMSRKQRFEYRGKVQAILQDPAGALNPRKTVAQAIGEIVRLHRMAADASEVRTLVLDSLETVGLSPASRFMDRRPGQLSGGQRQRVLIARALVVQPQLIIADEAVSALDASVKAGVLKVMVDIKERLGVGFLFITHDLEVVKKVAQRVIVMKSGAIVEEGSCERTFNSPQEVYTQELLNSGSTLSGAIRGLNNAK